MKSTLNIGIAMILALLILPQISFSQYNFEPSAEHPFGLPNPDAPKEIMDWAPLIGKCDCVSTSRNADGTWNDSQNMTWTFKYIMNGYGVQDMTLKDDSNHSGSIRQFNADSSQWYVHYYSNSGVTPILSAWAGNKQDTAIILYREQAAPNGTEGYYKIHFYDMTDNGFEWLGEWVNTAETFSYPTWKISCKREKADRHGAEIKTIKKLTADFSQALINNDYDAIANAYTEDGKIFPGRSDIISGRADVRKFWVLPEGVKRLTHKVSAEQINIIGNTAYDYGYFEGSNQAKDGNIRPFRGTYVIVWKKVAGEWKMELDIWN